jgi:hypothetical protein
VPCLYVHGRAAVNLRRRHEPDTDGHSNSYGINNSYSYGNSNSHGNCDCGCVTTAYADAQAATHATSTPISSSV